MLKSHFLRSYVKEHSDQKNKYYETFLDKAIVKITAWLIIKKSVQVVLAPCMLSSVWYFAQAVSFTSQWQCNVIYENYLLNSLNILLNLQNKYKFSILTFQTGVVPHLHQPRSMDHPTNKYQHLRTLPWNKKVWLMRNFGLADDVKGRAICQLWEFLNSINSQLARMYFCYLLIIWNCPNSAQFANCSRVNVILGW